MAVQPRGYRMMGAGLQLAFVGPMIGRNAGYVTTQGEILADRFAASGYSTITVSAYPNRYARLADIIVTLVTQRDRIDIQCLQVYGGPSFVAEDIASWLGRRCRHRVVMVLRGGALPDFMARYPRWSRRVLSRADAIVTPSRFLQSALRRHGFEAHVVPNVVNVPSYPYRLRRVLCPRLFWMRSFHHVYNPEMALRVLARVRQERPDATLVMAGQDKGEESRMRVLASSLKVEAAVRFPGYLDMPAKIRAGNAADVFLNTNRIDNTPVAVIEACAMGLPVVTTNVGGIPHLLAHGKTGLLVDSDDDAAMAESVLRLLSEPDLACRLSANGRELALGCSWEAVLPRWQALFEHVVGGQTGAERLGC